MYTRNIHIVITIGWVLLFAFPVQGQPEVPTWQSIEKTYLNKEINDSTYLKQIDQLVSRNNIIDSIEKKLARYQSIAFDKKEFVENRVKYWAYIAEDARMREQGGKAVYYYEKALNEAKSNKNLALKLRYMIQEQIIRIHSSNKNHDKTIASFLIAKKDIDRLPQLILQDSITNVTIITSSLLNLYYASDAYLALKDTAGVEASVALAQKILQSYNKIPIAEAEQPNSRFSNYLLHFIQFNLYWKLLQDKNYTEQNIITHFTSLMDTSWRGKILHYDALAVNVLDFLVDYYLSTGENQQAQKYLAELNKRQLFKMDQSFQYWNYQSILHANMGNFKLAYENLKQASRIKDSVNQFKLAEENDLWYSFTQAEYHKAEAEKISIQKNKIKNTAYILSIIALIVIASLYIYYLKKQRSLKDQIQNLNNMADFQIHALEEKFRQQRKEEQRKVGLELHDDLLSMLALIKHRIDLKTKPVKEPFEEGWIHETMSYLDKAYSQARNLSHRLYEQSDVNEDIHFEDRIQSLVAFAFPNNSYSKHVYVDAEVISTLNVEQRIEIMRIIQEAVTNIIKHAHAKNVEIMLFRENEENVLLVRDDGKGMPKLATIKSGIGIQSINKRVQALSGTLEVRILKQGTELYIRFATNK